MALSGGQIEILKYVDDSTKAIINGYIHQTTKSCNLKQEIPSEIVQVILLFYYLAEHFDIHPDDIYVMADSMDTIKKGIDQTSWNNMTFGAVSIPSISNNIIVWTFRMLYNNSPSGGGLGLGIINSKDANIRNTHIDGSDNTSISSYFYVNGLVCENGITVITDCERLGHAGTMIKMKLDMKKAELTYFRNDEDTGVVCKIDKGIDIEYRMAVILYWARAKIRLVNFECFSSE